MGIVIVILIVVALIGGVIWNHRNSGAAMAGVEFAVPQPPAAVAAAISNTYCAGAKAKMKSAVSRVTVKPSSSSSFVFGTKIGDSGTIEIRPADGSGSAVRAYTTELYVGSHPMSHGKSGLWGFASALSHGIYKLLGIAPYASKMKSFQSGLESRVTKQLSRSATA